MTILVLPAALALGYAFGRIRPWMRFGMWVEDQVLPHNHKRWVGRRGREWALFSAIALTRPVAAVEIWLDARHNKRGPLS